MFKMRKNRRLCLALALAFMLVAVVPSWVFADTANITCYLTVTEEPLVFDITERITMQTTQGNDNLTISPVKITNKGRDIKVSSLAVTGENGWTVANSSTDFANAKKTTIGVTCGSHDFADGAYSVSDKIAKGNSRTYSLSGKISSKADVTSGGMVSSMVVTVGKDGVDIVSWADGTDEEIVAMVNALDNGEITVADTGWKVGDTRTVHLSEMAGIDANDADKKGKYSAQDIQLTILHIGGYELANGKKCNFVVGQSSPLSGRGYMNKTDTNYGSWDKCKRRGWLNSTYKAAMPSTLAPIFKQFKTYTAVSWDSSELRESLDYFALPAEKEMFGVKKYSLDVEMNSEKIFQFDYYKNNKVDTWERSPDDSSNCFCLCYNSDFGGMAGGGEAYTSQRISPFGCI